MKKINLPLLPLLFLSLLFAACGNGAGQLSLNDLEARGRQVFIQNCASCHATQPGVVIVGPSLAHIATEAATLLPGMDAPAYIEQSVLDPAAYLYPGFKDLMPKDFKTRLSSEDLDALLAYLLTLE